MSLSTPTYPGLQCCLVPGWESDLFFGEPQSPYHISMNPHTEILKRMARQKLRCNTAFSIGDCIHGAFMRSEERRVGKECSSRRPADHDTEKQPMAGRNRPHTP